MTKKEINNIMIMSNSHLSPLVGEPIGVTKFQAFLAISKILKGKLYWYALKEAFTMSDNLYNYRVDLKEVFLCKEPNREYLMNKKERDFLAKLPEQITIYRGMTLQEKESNNFGISWTLDKNIAVFFANEYQRNYSTNYLQKTIHELTINKNELIAFFNERKEKEVIYISNN